MGMYWHIFYIWLDTRHISVTEHCISAPVSAKYTFSANTSTENVQLCVADIVSPCQTCPKFYCPYTSPSRHIHALITWCENYPYACICKHTKRPDRSWYLIWELQCPQFCNMVSYDLSTVSVDLRSDCAYALFACETMTIFQRFVKYTNRCSGMICN